MKMLIWKLSIVHSKFAGARHVADTASVSDFQSHISFLTP